MPANAVALTDAPIDVFGGLCTYLNPTDLPSGVSPDCRNVQFNPGSVGQRPGITPQFAAITNNPTVNYLKTFLQESGEISTLFFDSLGELWIEEVTSAPNVLTLVYSGLQLDSYCQSNTQFGREYMAFSDGKFGNDIPRQYDGTNFDRVSQVGPGAPPSAIADLTVVIDTLSRTGGVTTVVTTTAHGLVVGQLVTIIGASDASFNGTFPVQSIISPTSFTYYNSYTAIAIQNVFRVGGLVTVTLASNSALAGDVIIGGTNPTDGTFDVDGLFTATVIAPNQFTYTYAGIDGGSNAGTAYYLSQSYSPLPVSFINVTGTNLANVRMLNPLPDGQIFTVGENVTIAGTSVAGIDGTQVITFVPNLSPGENRQAFQFITTATEQSITTGTVSFELPNASASGGLVAGSGLISAGVHQCAVAFLTRQGYITKPSPPISWNALGGFKAQVTGIPIGPPNVIARILCFTGPFLDNFYYIGSAIPGNGTSTVVNDNTSTSAIVDFSDTALYSDNNVDSLFQLVVLNECAGVIPYNSRLFWWGQLNSIQNFQNLSFDGGFISAAPNTPLGWTPDATLGGGGYLLPSPAEWGFSYGAVYLGGGTHVTLGKISQSAFQDYLGVQILTPNTQYSIRAKLNFIGSNNTQGAAVVARFTSVSGSYSASVNLTSLRNSGWKNVHGILGTTPATIPSDFTFSIEFSFTDGALPSNGLYIDEIEIYPTDQPNILSDISASKAPGDAPDAGPEDYNGLTGFISINDNDGFAVRSAFQIRDQNLYFLKERGLYQTADDGINEPSNWSVNRVSATVGTPSVHGVAVGEDWAVIVDRAGLYLFWGSEPIKISEEIQTDVVGLGRVTWDSINWDAAQTIWITVDVIKKRILIGVPIGAATSPNVILYLSYIGVDGAQELAGRPPIRISQYTGKMIVLENSRKWSPWDITANSGAIIQRDDDDFEIWLGNGAGNGKIYKLDDTAIDDDGAKINSAYTTHYMLDAMTEQALQLGPHRKMFQLLTYNVTGVGYLTVKAVFPGSSYVQFLANIPLRSPAPWDTECPCNVAAERIAFTFQVADTDMTWQLSKFVAGMMLSKTAPVRGRN